MNDRQSIVELVRKWGGSASDGVLDPSCQIFRIPSLQGLIAYKDEPNFAVAFGDPVCSPEDVSSFAYAFRQYCQSRNKKEIYVTASDKFSNWAMEKFGGARVEFGEELYIDPYVDPRTREGVNASLVRRKVKHALKEEVIVCEYLEQDEKIEHEIEQVGISWLKSRKGPQIYLSHVRLFQDRFGKRWFYAKCRNKVVGIILLNHIQARQGWLLNRLMILPDAPHGTPEILVITALEAIAKEGSHFVTFGVVPNDQLRNIEGLGKCSSWIMPKVFKIVTRFFHLNRRKKFWEKFHPESEPSYLLFGKPSIGFGEIMSIMHALNLSL